MPNTLTGRNFDLKPDVREYVENKVGRFRKIFDNIQKVDVVLGLDKHSAHADLMVAASHATLKCTAKDASPLAAFDVAMEKMERQLARHKARMFGNKKHTKHTLRKEAGSPDAEFGKEEAIPEGLAEIFERIAQEEPKLPAAEPVTLRRMSLQEAWDVFERTDHQLLAFVDEETEKTRILHKNELGGLHLLEIAGVE